MTKTDRRVQKAQTPLDVVRVPEAGNHDAACPIEVTSDGIELDLGGAVLDGESFKGFGVFVHDCEGVTIRNGTIKGFYYGIRAQNVRRLRIENCVVSDNHNPSDVGWLPDTVDPVEDGFGGGIYLREVSGSLIQGNELNSNFNGLDLMRSNANIVRGNNTSGSGNIGIHLLGSSRNTLEDNRADHCIRFTGRFPNDTADSAGILLEEYSHNNRIVRNTMRYSGDGLFIRANNRHSSNHNYVALNDASFSPNNAFEAVFSEHNVFEENVAAYSNYGFWLGYSRHTAVRGNRIRWNRLDGVAIEHGSHNAIEANEIEGNRHGIRLWQDGRHANKDRSEDYVIRGNQIRSSRECGVLYSDTAGVVLENNTYQNNVADVRDAVAS